MTFEPLKFKHWKTQTVHPECRTVQCPAHDPIRDFRMEPTGCYVLIRPNKESGQIELAICSKQHEITRVFQGETAQSVYHTLFEYEKTNGLEWFQSKEHIAYLGKELTKCEAVLKGNHQVYIQE